VPTSNRLLQLGSHALCSSILSPTLLVESLMIIYINNYKEFVVKIIISRILLVLSNMVEILKNMGNYLLSS
jgi:hypothetical protein